MTAATLVASLGWTLVHFVWQGALIACAAALALTALRNGKPEHRYLVGCLALLACLLWPALDFVARIAEARAAVPAASLPAHLLPGPAVVEKTRWLAFLQDRLLLIVAVWAAGALALCLRLGLGLLWIGRAARGKSVDAHWQARVSRLAAQFGITRSVRLRIVEGVASPVTAGWWRPVVLLPATLVTGLPPDLLEALLAHELAHVKRFDYLVNLGQNVVETLLFYHPAVWWISGRIRAEREQIADDFAARQLGEPRRLALALSELEKFQFSNHHLALGATGGDLMSRIKRLVRPDTQALNWKAAIPVLGLAAACMALYANAAAPAAAASTPAVIDFRSCERPHYPADDLKAGHTGTVTLGFLVNEAGSVRESKVTKSSGFPGLDEAARSTIEKCSFKPATRDGQRESNPRPQALYRQFYILSTIF